MCIYIILKKNNCQQVTNSTHHKSLRGKNKPNNTSNGLSSNRSDLATAPSHKLVPTPCTYRFCWSVLGWQSDINDHGLKIKKRGGGEDLCCCSISMNRDAGCTGSGARHWPAAVTKGPPEVAASSERMNAQDRKFQVPHSTDQILTKAISMNSGEVTAGRLTRVLCSTLARMCLRERAFLGTPQHKSTHIVSSQQWRRDQLLPIVRRCPVLSPSVTVILDPLGATNWAGLPWRLPIRPGDVSPGKSPDDSASCRLQALLAQGAEHHLILFVLLVGQHGSNVFCENLNQPSNGGQKGLQLQAANSNKLMWSPLI